MIVVGPLDRSHTVPGVVDGARLVRVLTFARDKVTETEVVTKRRGVPKRDDDVYRRPQTIGGLPDILEALWEGSGGGLRRRSGYGDV